MRCVSKFSFPLYLLCFCHVRTTNFNMFYIALNVVSPLEGIVVIYEAVNKYSHENSGRYFTF